MKKSFSRLFAVSVCGFAALAFGFGCRNYVDVDGRSFATLTDREVGELVVIARATMAKNSPRHATAEELEVIRCTEPEIKIKYYGNRIGEAVIAWDLKTRKIEVVFDGHLTSNDPMERDIMLRVMKKYPPVLDFRPEQRRRMQGTPPLQP